MLPNLNIFYKNSQMANFIIGDVHGSFDKLMDLITKINFSDSDTLYFTGDLVNRGDKSLETLRFIYGLKDKAVVVLGNHDLHLLAIYHGVSEARKQDTFFEILTAKDRDELLFWLQTRSFVHFIEDYNSVLVHAGIMPWMSLAVALNFSKELQDVLKDKHQSKIFFSNMYGNTPIKWDNSLKHYERWRFLSNVFTRMRFCNKSYELDLKSKEKMENAPNNFKPWFNFELQIKQKIFFGHWAALNGKTNKQHVYALDTGCIWGGYLTAFDLDNLKTTCIDCSF